MIHTWESFPSGHSVVQNFPRNLWYLLVILQVFVWALRTNLSAHKSSQMAFSRTFDLFCLWFECSIEIWKQISYCILQHGCVKLSTLLAQPASCSTIDGRESKCASHIIDWAMIHWRWELCRPQNSLGSASPVSTSGQWEEEL